MLGAHGLGSSGDGGAKGGLSYLKWAAIGAVGAAALYALSSSPSDAEEQPPIRITDFDSFLTELPSEPTGLEKKKKKKALDPRWAATREGHCGGPFECFLLEDDEEKDEGTRVSAAPIVEERPTPDLARVLVLYGTEYGFSKEVAETLAGKLKDTKAFW